MHRPGLVRPAVALSTIILMAACSRSAETEQSAAQSADGLPEQVVGTASWDDHQQRPIHRVQCGFEPPFYTLQAEGHGFELRVGFWGDKARRLDDIDFEQADSVELTMVTPEEQIYRYTTLRILPEMGAVRGSERSVSGKTRLRATSLPALEEDRNGIELDFEFACPLSSPAPASES